MKYIPAILFLLFSNVSFGTVVWDWQVNNPNVTVTSSEKIIFSATLFNDTNSETLSELDSNLSGEVEILTFLVLDHDNDIFDKYSYDIGVEGSGTIRSQFSGVAIEPGESFNFVLYTLIPKLNKVTNGNYEVDVNTMILTSSSQGFIDYGSTNITVVPIPAAFQFFLVALFGMVPFKKRKLFSYFKYR